MTGNLGPTMVRGYDSEGNSAWFPHALPEGYTASPPEAKEKELSAKDKEKEILGLIEELEDDEQPIAASER